MTALVIFTVIIILLLLYSVRIVYSINLLNFSASVNVVLKTPFKKKLFNTDKPKKQAKEKESKKTKNKINLEIIKKLKTM